MSVEIQDFIFPEARPGWQWFVIEYAHGFILLLLVSLACVRFVAKTSQGNHFARGA
jgi:hypothetical protein